MDSYYPVFLQLKGRSVVVIGGGIIAERKIRGLIPTGAVITVISPDLTKGLLKLVESNHIRWCNKRFKEVDINEAYLIVAATNVKETNEEVRKTAKSSQLLNIIDDPLNSNFILPSVIKRGRLQIAVSTSGASPLLAKKIKRELEEEYDEGYESYVDFLFQCRQFILENVKDSGQKKQLLSAIIEDSTFHCSKNREEAFQQLYENIVCSNPFEKNK